MALVTLYASLIGFHPRRLKVPTGDEFPRNGLRSMRCLLLLLLEVGLKKVACWSTKAAISLKRVKIEEKLPWGL